jgi:hypothetical protein
MPDSDDTIDNSLPGRFEDTDFAAVTTRPMQRRRGNSSARHREVRKRKR